MSVPGEKSIGSYKGAFWFKTARHLVCMLEGVGKSLFRVSGTICVNGACLVMVEHVLLHIFTFPWVWDVLVNYQRRRSCLSQSSYVIIYFSGLACQLCLGSKWLHTFSNNLCTYLFTSLSGRAFRLAKH